MAIPPPRGAADPGAQRCRPGSQGGHSPGLGVSREHGCRSPPLPLDAAHTVLPPKSGAGPACPLWSVAHRGRALLRAVGGHTPPNRKGRVSLFPVALPRVTWFSSETQLSSELWVLPGNLPAEYPSWSPNARWVLRSATALLVPSLSPAPPTPTPSANPPACGALGSRAPGPPVPTPSVGSETPVSKDRPRSFGVSANASPSKNLRHPVILESARGPGQGVLCASEDPAPGTCGWRGHHGHECSLSSSSSC